MEAKNDIIAILTSGVLVLLFFIFILLYQNYKSSKKARKESKG